MTEDRINRQTRIVRADLCFDGIAWGAKGARSDLSFHGGAEGPHIHCVFERIVEDSILGISRTAGSPLEADQGESARIAHGIIIDDPVGSQRVLPAVSQRSVYRRAEAGIGRHVERLAVLGGIGKRVLLADRQAVVLHNGPEPVGKLAGLWIESGLKIEYGRQTVRNLLVSLQTDI